MHGFASRRRHHAAKVACRSELDGSQPMDHRPSVVPSCRLARRSMTGIPVDVAGSWAPAPYNKTSSADNRGFLSTTPQAGTRPPAAMARRRLHRQPQYERRVARVNSGSSGMAATLMRRAAPVAIATFGTFDSQIRQLIGGRFRVAAHSGAAALDVIGL